MAETRLSMKLHEWWSLGTPYVEYFTGSGIYGRKFSKLLTKGVQNLGARLWLKFCSFPREMLVWVDETGSNARKQIRRFSYSPAYRPFTTVDLCVESENPQSLQYHVKDWLALTWKISDKFIDFLRGTLMQPLDASGWHISRNCRHGFSCIIPMISNS